MSIKLLNELIKRGESESLDFKREYKGNAKEYLHILLCLMNSSVRQEKHLVFGVDDKKNIIGLAKEIESSEFNNFLAQAPLNISFSIRVDNVFIDNKIVSIVTIPENLGHIYVIKSQKYDLFPNFVYTRTGCSNTGKDKTADPAIIEKIIRKKDNLNYFEGEKNVRKLKINEDVFIQFHEAIKDSVGWESVEEYDNQLNENVSTFFYKYNMSFSLKSFHYSDEFSEPWAKDAPNPLASAYKIELRYNNQKICEKYYVSVDGGRYRVIYPNVKAIGSHSKNPTFYYYFIRNTMDYDLNFVINNGKTLYLNRMSNVEIPVFESIESAEETIEEDFNSGKRNLLSYTYDESQDYVASINVKNYVRYPRFETK